jgi:tRNA dimethylallyltransferase
MKQNALPKLIVILGPTASGKTDLAMRLAKAFNGEIISADSRQIYKEMNIGTAKPKAKIIKHHLIDIIRPDEDFNASLYKKLATKAIKNVLKKRKLPFLVGGTGLYIKAVVDNVFFPKVPPQKKLRKELEVKTVKQLFDIYEKLDPEGAKFIEKSNKRRLIRAIEVCRVTKKPFWKQREKKEAMFNVLQIGINLSKNELKKRVIKRTDKMLKQGLEDETKRLLKKYKNSPLLQTIGYREWFEENSKSKVKEKIATHTLQFAKRQMTWFKRDKRINWIKNYKQAKILVKNF